MSDDPQRPTRLFPFRAVRHLTVRFRVSEVWLVVAVGLVSLGGYIVFMTDDLFPGGDNARYMIFAQSLLTGNGYRNVGNVSMPSHTVAPPGFAVLLMPVVWTLGLDVLAARSLVAVCGAVAVGVVYRSFRRSRCRAHALTIALLFGIAPVTYMYARRVYADLPFVALSLGALAATEAYARRACILNRTLLGAVLLCSVSFYVRPAALAAVLAAVLWLFVRKTPGKAMLLGAGVALTVVPWYVWAGAASGSPAPGHIGVLLDLSGVGQLAGLATSNMGRYGNLVAENLWYLSARAPEHLHLPASLVSSALWASTICTVGLIVVGLWKRAKTSISLAEIYVCIYVLALLPYAFVIDRFVLPILPFLIDYYLRGVGDLVAVVARRTGVRAALLVRVVLVGMVVLSGSAHLAARLYQERRFSAFAPRAAAHYEVARWARGRLEANAAVVTQFRDHFYVYSGLQTWDPRAEPLDAVIGRSLYAVLDSSTRDGPQSWLAQAGFEVVTPPLHCSSDAFACLYRVCKAPATTSP